MTTCQVIHRGAGRAKLSPTRRPAPLERTWGGRGTRAMQRPQVTQILSEIGDRPEAAEELLPLVYDELRKIAGARMRGERASHTLQATALVHEAYLKLLGGEGEFESRKHFFRAAAEAMRRLLIDHARKKKSDKRGGGRPGIALEHVQLACEDQNEEILAVHEGLDLLEREDPRAADVVRLRFFAGLNVQETAEALEISERTVMREWAFARARMLQLLQGEG